MNDELRNLNYEDQICLDGSSPVIRDAAGYVNIKFQAGPIKEHGVNGTSIENIIDLLIKRLEGFQAGPFKCDYNARAIECLYNAANELEQRTIDRVNRGVEGENRK